jgi:hypothetical protein
MIGEGEKNITRYLIWYRSIQISYRCSLHRFVHHHLISCTCYSNLSWMAWWCLCLGYPSSVLLFSDSLQVMRSACAGRGWFSTLHALVIDKRYWGFGTNGAQIMKDRITQYPARLIHFHMGHLRGTIFASRIWSRT